MTGCLSQRDIAAFLAESASPEQLTSWRRHLRLCDSCATAVARLRVGLESERQGPPEREGGPKGTHEKGLFASIEPNLQLGDFRLERRLGAGGMGVVYQALQVSLSRRVALKVLPSTLVGDASAIERFHREARAAATLRHPNIVTIHAEGLEQGICYFAMEMIEGEPLDRVIEELRATRTTEPRKGPALFTHNRPDAPADDGTLSVGRTSSLLRDCRCSREYFDLVARLISEVAEALDYAHQEGIIHRDVKPSNLILAHDGRLVLLDFGIARICKERAMTLTGSFIGTPRYMSPEQISGSHDQPDQRSDIYSLGVTLYELLTLEPLFDGNTKERVISQILSRNPARPRRIERRIPVDLETICCKAIAKEPDQRYGQAGEFAEDLRRYLSGRVIKAKPPGIVDRSVKFLRRRKVAAILACGVVLALALAASIAWKHYTTRWAQQDAMAQIDQLIQQDDYFAAFVLAEKAERYIPDDPLLASRWPRLSRTFEISSDPPGASVFVSEYHNRKPKWKYLGRSPIKRARVPFGTYRWKLEKPGFVIVEVVRSNDLPAPYTDASTLCPKPLDFPLYRKGRFPADMVWIPPAELDQKSLFHGKRKIPGAPAFLIDKYEVTNHQFKAFVDGGGYADPNLWEHAFVRDGHVLPWSQAIEAFRDRTGRFGPATWEKGTYPSGHRNCPVGGISWHEAAAYAKFQGKDLPTIYHWTAAARADDEPYRITSLSNFGDGPARVGRHKGMGRFGLYDAAGNVREWCHNGIEGVEDSRCVLGGTWGDYDTAFINGAMRSPWDRDPANGLRCVKYLDGKEAIPEQAFAPVEHKRRDFASFRPVSDEILDSYIDTAYRYDRTELNARVELIDEDLGYCWRERITFNAAYPNERVTAYLHLPKEIQQPYQVVLWYPSGIARFSPWDQRAYTHELVGIIRSGRAVLVPFYKGTYDRRLEKSTYPPDGIQSKNLYVQRSQDLRRSVDYLETRDDVDIEKLAYVGLAWGGQMGPVMIATEERFKTGILLLGGICGCQRHPASDPANFAPRVKIPMLMLNGKEDSLFPHETAQKPLFRLLGTPPDQKKHVTFPGEHNIPWEFRELYHQEIIQWLDQHLGPPGRVDEDPNGSVALAETVTD